MQDFVSGRKYIEKLFVGKTCYCSSEKEGAAIMIHYLIFVIDSEILDMMDMTSKLYKQLEKLNLWDKNIYLKRNEYLKIGGTIETNLFYIISGSLKISILDHCEEHIIRFGYKHNFITALDSFITEKPSDFYIQAIKRTELKTISKQRYLDFIRQNDELREFWDTALQQLILQQIEREKDILITSPKERYKRILQRSPQLFQEIPNKYIASYLRMSPETLSRLKKS